MDFSSLNENMFTSSLQDFIRRVLSHHSIVLLGLFKMMDLYQLMSPSITISLVTCNTFPYPNLIWLIVTDYLFGVCDRSEGADQEWYVDWFELNVMGTAPGKCCVCDVGMLLQSLGKTTWLSLGSLSLVKGLTMKRTLVISYTNWSRAGVVPLMSPWQDKSNHRSGIEMHGV